LFGSPAAASAGPRPPDPCVSRYPLRRRSSSPIRPATL
jgi:hypothetical protein